MSLEDEYSVKIAISEIAVVRMLRKRKSEKSG